MMLPSSKHPTPVKPPSQITLASLLQARSGFVHTHIKSSTILTSA